MEQRDALFVINQNITLSDFRELCHTEHIRSALLLTTHRVFPTEQDIFNQIGNDVKIISFADLLTEADMIKCDEAAKQILLGKGGCGTTDHNSRFMTISLSEKNRIVHEKLSSAYKFRKIYYMPGLGVSEVYWEKIGVPLCTVEQSLEIKSHIKKIMLTILMPPLKAARLAKKFLLPASKDVIIRNNGKTFVFLSPLKRLRIRSETPVKNVKTRYCRFDSKNIYCMTIHGYDRTLAEKLGGVLIFVDGYHPSNYPRSYIDSYGESDVFVVRTMFDERWFTTYNRRTMKPPAFLERELFASCAANSANRVLIALNHAGDWTALINRSDTDDLVIAAAEMARNLPEVIFRIRTHPTMNHPAHEGLHSSVRIERFVRSVKLANLHTSTHSLSEDIEWCDICLSEYSQVLLDALLNGKFGVAVNLTRRRSFMEDYAILEFYHAHSTDRAIEILHYINVKPREAALKQNKAVMSYNVMLTKWLGKH